MRQRRSHANECIFTHAAEARKRAGSAITTAAPDVREAMQALQARITDSPMPTLILEEVVAAQRSHAGAAPETRPMTSAGIVNEYHTAEEKLAQARGEEWERQRQRVADKVREKRQAKTGGDAPCDAAAQQAPALDLWKSGSPPFHTFPILFHTLPYSSILFPSSPVLDGEALPVAAGEDVERGGDRVLVADRLRDGARRVELPYRKEPRPSVAARNRSG
eukprot:gene16909-biopygen13189